MASVLQNLSLADVRREFRCSPRQLRKFECSDPMNPDIVLTGYRCRKMYGKYAGSLYITHVNGKPLPQIIYGVPKQEYPYSGKNSNNYKQKWPLEATHYYLANKWNGMNVLFYKFIDHNNRIRISAKSKGATVLSDTQFGPFLTNTFVVLDRKIGDDLTKNTPDILKPLLDPQWQSMSFELCGRKEKHLVKYDFDIDLKPLFTTTPKGRIKPWRYNDPNVEIGPLPFDVKEMIARCKRLQEECYQMNVEFRKKHNLPHRYEFEHFAHEGYVLYILDAEGFLINRTMYKIKPPDVEEVHWQQFDSSMEARVKEAVQKMVMRDLDFTETSLRRELDMGPKEWGKFGSRIMKYARTLPLWRQHTL